jgi:hypothetical protein
MTAFRITIRATAEIAVTITSALLYDDTTPAAAR